MAESPHHPVVVVDDDPRVDAVVAWETEVAAMTEKEYDEYMYGPGEALAWGV
jgi:hypothetical protein